MPLERWFCAIYPETRVPGEQLCIAHPSLGRGRIAEIAMDRVAVAFDQDAGTGTIRKLAARWVRENFRKLFDGTTFSLLRRQYTAYLADERNVDRIVDECRAALTPTISDDVGLPVPELSKDDVRLALRWYRGGRALHPEKRLDSGINLAEWAAENEDDAELTRLLSARCSELAVGRLFAGWGASVRDVSRTQLDGGADREWSRYDLLVNGWPVDVKNARRSSRAQLGYVEYCVPEFKKSRTDRSVRLAGVLSTFAPPSALLTSSAPSSEAGISFLGLVLPELLETVVDAFADGDVLERTAFSSLGRQEKFLPPWVFDYPVDRYVKRDAFLARTGVTPLPSLLSWLARGVNPLPLLVASGAEYSVVSGVAGVESQPLAFASELRDRVRSHGLSLPVVYLTVLTDVLRRLRERRSRGEQFQIEGYRRALFLRYSDVGRGSRSTNVAPLGIYDPLATVDTLITTLSTLWHAAPSPLGDYRKFRLRGLNILDGHSGVDGRGGAWRTLIAYCGGRLSSGFKCATAPLVFGECRHCRGCGRLICPNCGYCGEQCPHVGRRSTRSPV